jgi:hypothetical protein
MSLVERVFKIDKNKRAGLPSIKVMGFFCFGTWPNGPNPRF